MAEHIPELEPVEKAALASKELREVMEAARTPTKSQIRSFQQEKPNG